MINLRDALRGMPDEFFFKDGTRAPDYNHAFAYVVRKSFRGSMPNTAQLLRRIENGDLFNLTTFQRAVAQDRKRRESESGARKKAGKPCR